VVEFVEIGFNSAQKADAPEAAKVQIFVIPCAGLPKALGTIKGDSQAAKRTELFGFSHFFTFFRCDGKTSNDGNFLFLSICLFKEPVFILSPLNAFNLIYLKVTGISGINTVKP
jgi:hypothetical protein